MGTATAAPELHGPRLETLLERLVDTPVRGIVYEAAGTVEPALLAGGAAACGPRERWRMPAEVVEAEPADHARGWPRCGGGPERLL